MSYDAADTYIKYMKAYGAERGWIPSGDASGTLVPNTTWGDVVAFYALFSKETTDASLCVAHAYMSLTPTWSLSSLIMHGGSYAFTAAINRCKKQFSSDRFQSALAVFQAADPMKRAWDLWGTGYPAATALAITTREPYPFNVEFWQAMRTFAIARSAAGHIRGSFELAVESFSEAVKDLPEAVQDALRNVWEGLPQVTALLKWLAILGGVGVAALATYYIGHSRNKD